MKTMKKLLALVLALTMVFALSATAFAATSSGADKFTITITNPDPDNVSIAGKTFTAYQIFDVTYDDDKYTYTFVDAIKAKTAEGERFEIVVGEAPNAVTYWGDREMNPPDDNANPKDTSILAYLEAESGKENGDRALKFAADMLEWITTNKIAVPTKALEMDAEGADDAESKTFTMDKPGYYLVTGSAKNLEDGKNIASGIILTTTNPDATINPKVEPLPVTKKATDHKLDEAGKAAESEVGKKVPYEITTEIPDMTAFETFILTVTDQMSEGLTFDENSLKVKFVCSHGEGEDPVEIPGTINADAYTDYELDTTYFERETDPEYDYNAKGARFAINFPNIIKAKDVGEDHVNHEGDKVVITYEATVNGDALDYNWEENTANISYGRDPENLTGSTPKTVYVYDFDIEVNKYFKDASGSDKPLANAEFVLRRSATAEDAKAMTGVAVGDYLYYKFTPGTTETVPLVEWIKLDAPGDAEWDHKEYGNTTDNKNKGITVVKTDKDGKALFQGLKTGDYELVEVKAPDGYNMLLDAIDVTIKAEVDANGKIIYKGKDHEDSKTTVDAPTGDNDERGEGQPVVTPDVENKYGKLLPTTGGMGTTLFYILGSIMMIGAAVILVAKKRTSI